VNIHLNGETREFSDGLTVEALIATLALDPTRVAIELNQSVVRRSQWATTILHNGDQVEIVHFVGGGANPKGCKESSRWSESAETTGKSKLIRSHPGGVPDLSR
jgi:thiamine biosynthesis protein ThiS